MDTYNIVNLEKLFYRKLYDNMLRYRKKLINKSLLITMMEVKSNTRLRLVNESSLPPYVVAMDELNMLKEKSLIRLSDNEVDKFVITALGIWEVEREKGILDEKVLLQYINGKWFNFAETDQSLSEKEKVIILSMIAARTFSENSPVDLKLNENALNVWKEVLESSYQFLKDQNIIKNLNLADLYGKKGNEHPVSQLIRHTDILPKKTRGIYTALGNQKYYLRIYQGSELSSTQLSYLFKLIFQDQIDYQTYQDILKFCHDVTWEKAIHIFDNIENHIFVKLNFDEAIQNSLRGLFFS